MKAWLALSKWLWEYEIHGAAPEATKTAGGILCLSYKILLNSESHLSKQRFFFFFHFKSRRLKSAFCQSASWEFVLWFDLSLSRREAAGLRCESRSLNPQQMLPLVFSSRKYSTAIPRLSKFCSEDPGECHQPVDTAISFGLVDCQFS